MKGWLLTISTVCFCIGCTSISHKQKTQINHLNDLSYKFRYKNIDSALVYANVAYHQSISYPEGREEAVINRAFVAYQQMNYDTALGLLSRLKSNTRNQYNLLCANVLTMKIAQRIGDGETFFSCRNASMRILKRINESSSEIDSRHQQLVNYASSELHIVSSTYYFYLGLDSAAITEINKAYDIVQHSNDTAQWLYYNYMLGSGGLLKGDKQNVLREEFDYLFRTYTLAKQEGNIYFQANALQSLATLLSDSASYNYLSQLRGTSFDNLFQQHLRLGTHESMSLALAQHSINLFRKSKDLFQTACAHRTLGEVYFKNQQFDLALKAFHNALTLVETQKHRSTYSVIPWMASIREKLSMTYSALGNTEEATLNRAVYLQLLNEFRQNYESETRLNELKNEVQSVRYKIVILILLIAFTLFLLLILMNRMKSRVKSNTRSIIGFFQAAVFKDLEKSMNETIQMLTNKSEELQDSFSVSNIHLNNYKSENIERRAKVSLVYSIVPYLERMIAEVRRMSNKHMPDAESLQYVHELSLEIMRINEALTHWIKMSQGRLKLHISTFPLHEVFHVISLSRSTFEQKGIQLHIGETDALVKADRALTLFMVNTLCDNARKFTPSGGSVSIKIEEHETYVEIQVNDTGVGLTDEEVSILNDTKFYDARNIGNGEQKGFGFGIMNCRGIINKYRKTSKIFEVCHFGVNSQLGKGSSFWFRLPRIIGILLFCFTASHTTLADSLAKRIDSIRIANASGQYEKALEIGLSLQHQLPESFDTANAIKLYNETAIAALSLRKWDVYKHSNSEYVRLHQLYTRDANIESYCIQMQKLQSDTILLYAFLILFSLFAVLLFYTLFLRPRLRTDRQYRYILEEITRFICLTRQAIENFQTDSPKRLQEILDHDRLEQEAETIHHCIAAQLNGQAQYLQTVDSIFMHIGTLYDRLLNQTQALITHYDEAKKVRFEEERLYVMNQILDNCLSTIKHETMYYPARAKQLVENILSHTDDAERLIELNDLLNYYKEVYMLLYQQAEHQLEQNNFKRESLSVAEQINTFILQTKRMLIRTSHNVRFEAKNHNTSLRVIADRQLLQTLFQNLLRDYYPHAHLVSIWFEERTTLVEFTFSITLHTEILTDNISDFFTPGHSSVSHLIARQIIREHDSYSGFPGLRLIAESIDNKNLRIRFTLLKDITPIND